MNEASRRYRPLVLGFAGFVALQGASAAWLFVQKLGVRPAAVAAFYRGGENAVARSFSGLLEVVVPHLLAVPLTLFIVVHLVAWARPEGAAAQRKLATVTFALVLVSVAAGLLTRYAWPQFAWLKLVAFFGGEAMLAWWVAALAAAWWSRADSTAPDADRAHA